MSKEARWHVAGLDFLDKASGTLYCSKTCALKGGARKLTIVDPGAFEALMAEMADEDASPGATCPICEKEYNNL